MRSDIAGLFWDDTPPPKVVKEVIKRTPPERIWEAPDYLPNLEEACQYIPTTYTGEELTAAYVASDPHVFDVEVYPNFFFVTFTNVRTLKCIAFEMSDWEGLDIDKLRWVYTSFQLVGFNSLFYDAVMVNLACDYANTEQLQWATEELILRNARPQDVYKAFKCKPLKCDMIDLIEVAPLSGSLKAYGGRLHSKRMQDLPFVPGTMLTYDQACIVRWYNGNDLSLTLDVYNALQDQLKLRVNLSHKYGLDLRSKSDAQIAEAVINSELRRMNGYYPKRPTYEAGRVFFYQPPPFLVYQTDLLRWVLHQVCTAPFIVGEDGRVELPAQIRDIKLQINMRTYQMGIGGLHSNEQKAVFFSSNTHTVYDRDVISYYPKLILNSGMFPPQMGKNFVFIYNGLVFDRIKAKAAKNFVEADSGKIIVNGTFGKTLSPQSTLSYPEMGLQCTINGQLSLLMLIERLELAGIPVVSANTDGVVIYCPNDKSNLYLAIIKQWEADTNLETEEATYHAIYSRDVNNYMAVKKDGKVKAKGCYMNAWNDPALAIFRFHKNPVNMICNEAIEQYLTKGTSLVTTVLGCIDFTKFVTVRNVKGGGVKDGVYLGKCVRWYYAQGVEGEIIYASNGHAVARSEGAKPCMLLPDGIPNDLNYEWYIREADSMLQDMGLASTLTQEIQS